MTALNNGWRTLRLGFGIGVLLFGLLAVLAKLARTFRALRLVVRAADVAVRPIMMVTEHLFGQSPLAAVGMLLLFCLGAGFGLALVAQWLGRRRQ